MRRQLERLVLIILILTMVICQSNNLQESQELQIQNVDVQQNSLEVAVPQENNEQQKKEQEQEIKENDDNLQQSESTEQNGNQPEQKPDENENCQNGLIKYFKTFIQSIQEEKETKTASFNQLNYDAKKKQQFEFALLQLSDILRTLQLKLKIEEGKSCEERSKIIDRTESVKINMMVQIYQNTMSSVFAKTY